MKMVKIDHRPIRLMAKPLVKQHLCAETVDQKHAGVMKGLPVLPLVKSVVPLVILAVAVSVQNVIVKWRRVAVNVMRKIK
jgi:hypothetical protein